jgi:FkbM family methyltransferase
MKVSRVRVLARAQEYLATFVSRTVEILQRAERGTKRVLLLTYWRIKVKSAWFALSPRHMPEKENLLGWHVFIGDYSDFVFLFEEIFISQSYRLPIDNPSPTIVDCGANIGLATLYFKWRFPRSTIVDIEPEPGAFSRLERTISENSIDGVTARNEAVGRTKGRISFTYSPLRPASPVAGQKGHLDESEEIEVQVVPVSSLVDKPIDLVKIDVEGAESDVIEDLVETGAIERVRYIALEYHHHLRPDDDRMSQVIGRLERADFGYQIVRLRLGELGQYQDLVLHGYHKVHGLPPNGRT